MKRPALGCLLVSLTLALAAIGKDARASVSIAVTFDALVRTSSAVAIVTPAEQRSLWENGRIYTYTRIHVDTPVAGELPANAEAWVRTMGGVVGNIGQAVDGEPVLTVGRPSLLFLHPGPPGSYDVTARAQGQFAIRLDERRHPLLVKSNAVGALLAPQPPPPPGTTLAADVLHGRAVDDAVRDIGAAWSRLHAP